MIVGIGSDIARVARFRQALERHGERFAERILGQQEQQVWRAKGCPVAYLAKRFAAKEAFVKALGLACARACSGETSRCSTTRWASQGYT